jgi:glutaredoxin 2
MEWPFGIMEIIFLVFSCIVLFIQHIMKKSETEIDRVMREAEQVKHTHAEVIYIRSEIHNDEIYIWNVLDNTFLTQGKTFEDAVQKFMKNNPNKKLHIKVTE